MENNPKKILFICQYFYPEVFRGNDIAFHLTKVGHEVHVVTGTPNYPGGKFFDGYGIFKKRHENVNGVKVTHLPIIPRGNNKIMLMLNYFSFFIIGCLYMLWHALFHKYDVVFCQQLSPVMMSLPAVLYKKLRNAPLYTWVLDLWPESLTAAGGIKNKYVLAFFDWFVKKEYKHSDKILISSNSFKEDISKYGDYQDKIVYYPQWGDGSTDIGELSALKEKMPQIPSGFVVMFAGAMGEAHGMECNLQAALLTKEHKDIKWVFVGDGRKLDWMKCFIKEHQLEETVFTLGRYPSNMMPFFFEKANVMLVSLTDSSLFNMYCPAKISSYMAYSKPIIACLNGEGADVIKTADAGWCVCAGDADKLAETVVSLYQNQSALQQKGRNAYSYYSQFFDKEKSLKKLEQILNL
ncbi:MAG: glycosyltransferase family 4 protein [Paludibacteraceae bacterium]|nr:glycosyltransferase family 4 protein [Paludibacteraceae bacterium]